MILPFHQQMNNPIRVITEEAIENTRIQMESGDWSRSYKQSIKNTSRSVTKTEKTVTLNLEAVGLGGF